MRVTQVSENCNVALFENATGVYARIGKTNKGIFVQPSAGNSDGFRHVNFRPRKLNFDNMTPYEGVVTLQN